MKSIVCEKPDHFRMMETDEPVLREDHALIRVRRIGVCGTDLHAYKGRQPFFTYPRILGHELSGTIEAVGANPYGFSQGDKVCVIPYLHCGDCAACLRGKTNCCLNIKVLGVHEDGGMREIISVPLSHILPTDTLTLEQAAVIEPLSIGAHAVRRAGLQEGDTALVIGAGPIGLGVVSFAKERRAKVIVMDVNDQRLDFCRNWAQVDHTVNALNDPLGRLADLTDGEMPHVVFDATGNLRSMQDAFGYTAHGGKLVYVGLVKADISFHDPDFHKKELTLLGSRNATREDFRHVIDSVGNGMIDVNKYVTHRVPFEAMIEHFDSWLLPETGVNKAMLEL